MKRLGIFITYDKDNMIDEYIGYLLKNFKMVVSHLVVICNMAEIVSGQEHLENYADEIFYRKNKGYDAGAYKDVLCNLIGWERVLEYDELVLLNDSLFGPFMPMQNIFQTMKEKECDFWGLTKHRKYTLASGREVFPEHIQSFFLVVRRKMLHDKLFQQFWEDMPECRNLEEAVYNFELKFSVYFSEKGYRYGWLTDMQPNESVTNTCTTFNQYIDLPYELISKRNFPFLKRKAVVMNDIDRRTQENISRALDYIDRETEYDVGLILKKVIREFDISDLQRSLCINYIVPKEQMWIRDNENSNWGIIVVASNGSAFEFTEDYLLRIGQGDNVIVCSDKKDILGLYRKNGYKTVDLGMESRQRLMQAVLNWKYVCVIHDEDLSCDVYPSYQGKALFFGIWENLLKSRGHIEYIVKQFENNPYLGALTVPNPNFGNYFSTYDMEWDVKNNRVRQAAGKYQLAFRILADKPPFALFHNFWICGNIFNKILEEYDKDDLEVLPYLLGYFVQREGCYSGLVESSKYAAMNEVNMQRYLTELCTFSRLQLGGFHSLKELRIRMYSAGFQQVYVYGTGEEAERYSAYVNNIKGYVVSDGQLKKELFLGLPVRYLAEIEPDDSIGIVLCLNEKNRERVIPLLEKAGISNYLAY